MTVKQLIEKLSQFPPDMPVATWNDINPNSREDPDFIKVEKAVWVHGNFPYDKPDFEYVNLL